MQNKIVLKDYQQEAVKKALKIKKCLWLIQTGAGKTLPSIFLGKLLFKKKEIDKMVIAVTPSAVISYINTFERMLKFPIRYIENLEKDEDRTRVEKNVQEFKNWLESDEKIVLIKHSLLEELGTDTRHIDYMEKSLKKNYKKILLVLDEAHELNNTDSLGHKMFKHIDFMWDRILLMTATPWSSSIVQLYGLVCLIYPKLWKSKSAFKVLHVIEEVVLDWKGKFSRVDEVAYTNIKLLRETISPLTYFYYPKRDIEFHLHYVPLKDYTEYDKICSGKIEKEAKVKKKKKGKE